MASLIDLAPNEMPLLRQEEERRQQTRLGGAIGAILAVLIAVSFLSIFTVQSCFRETRALESSMFSAGRMVQSVASQLNREGNDAPLRRRLLNEGCDLLDKLRVEADREARIAELVTCRVERGYKYEATSDQESALASFRQALDLASYRHTRTGTTEAAVALVQAREEFAFYLQRQKDNTKYVTQLELLLGTADEFSKPINSMEN